MRISPYKLHGVLIIPLAHQAAIHVHNGNGGTLLRVSSFVALETARLTQLSGVGVGLGSCERNK